MRVVCIGTPMADGAPVRSGLRGAINNLVIGENFDLC